MPIGGEIMHSSVATDADFCGFLEPAPWRTGRERGPGEPERGNSHPQVTIEATLADL